MYQPADWMSQTTMCSSEQQQWGSQTQANTVLLVHSLQAAAVTVLLSAACSIMFVQIQNHSVSAVCTNLSLLYPIQSIFYLLINRLNLWATIALLFYTCWTVPENMSMRAAILWMWLHGNWENDERKLETTQVFELWFDDIFSYILVDVQLKKFCLQKPAELQTADRLRQRRAAVHRGAFSSWGAEISLRRRPNTELQERQCWTDVHQETQPNATWFYFECSGCFNLVKFESKSKHFWGRVSGWKSVWCKLLSSGQINVKFFCPLVA